MLLRNDILDCEGYYFHLRYAHERRDGAKYSFSCPRSIEHKTERDPLTIERYTAQKEYFECQGELHISFSKANESATIIYKHVGHTESQTFHMTEDVQNYIRAHKLLPPHQIYQNLIQMTNKSDFEHSEVQFITRQQVYNFWLSLT